MILLKKKSFCKVFQSSSFPNSVDSENKTQTSMNISSSLKKLRAEHSRNIFFEQRNINSLRNKSELIEGIIKDTLDVLLASQCKLDS